MAMKHYPPEFEADAIAPYRSQPGATIAHNAAELGTNREILRKAAAYFAGEMKP